MVKNFSQMGLYVFKVAVESGTFRAASQLLYISQPAVSAHIHRIEQELGIELFQRPYGRKLRLTEAGQLVYAYAVDVLAKNIEIEKLTKELSRGELGEVKIAFSNSKFLIASLVSSFRKQFPKIDFVLRTGNSYNVQQLVMNGDVDFGISLRSNNTQLLFKLFYYEPMVMICSSGHPLISEKVITEDGLNRYGIIGGLPGTEYDSSLHECLSNLGILNYKVTSQAEDPLMVLKILEKGFESVGLILLSAAKESLERGSIVELSYNNIKQPPQKVYLVFRRGARLTTGSKLLINFLKDEITKHYPFITLNTSFRLP